MRWAPPGMIARTRKAVSNEVNRAQDSKKESAPPLCGGAHG